MNKWSQWKKGEWSMSVCSLFIAALLHEAGFPNEQISYTIKSFFVRMMRAHEKVKKLWKHNPHLKNKQ
jgi:hypothetical protein